MTALPTSESIESVSTKQDSHQEAEETSTDTTPELEGEFTASLSTDTIEEESAKRFSLNGILVVFIILLIAAQAWSTYRLFDLEAQMQAYSADLATIGDALDTAQSDIRSAKRNLETLQSAMDSAGNDIALLYAGIADIDSWSNDIASDINATNRRLNSVVDFLELVSAVADNADKYAHCHGYNCY